MPLVAFIAKNRVNPAYDAALFGASAVAARFGYTVRHSAPQTTDDIGEQAELIARAAAEHPAAMILIPAHATRLGAATGAVNRAGIPLISIVGEAGNGDWVCHVGSDDVRLARDIALALLPRLRAGAQVAIMDGHPDSITTPGCHRGFVDALAAFSALHLVESVTGHYQSEPARAATLDLLARHPALDALLVANDLMAIGVLQALAETRRKLLLVGVNGTPAAVKAVAQGRLVATACFDTLAFGCLAMEAAARHLRGETVPRRIVLPSAIIDAANWPEWDRPYAARRQPDWDATLAAR